MKRGAWHQFGDRSQKLAVEQLEHSAGVGVIVSPRDLAFNKATEYALQYNSLGADILLDQQFYFPAANVGKLETYPIASERAAVSKLARATTADIEKIKAALHESNQALGTTAVLAPAVVYAAGRADVDDLNAKLFAAAKDVAENLGIPCYATVFLDSSITGGDPQTDAALGAATSLGADGWYYGFEFGAVRVPASEPQVSRYLKGGLTLATTAKPVLHAYVGLMAPLALACGATGAAIGHSQNLWQFTRARWEAPSGGGGGGDAPPRYFSDPLWGTVIYVDEWLQLPPGIRRRILTPSPFSQAVTINPPFVNWDRWSANKHIVYSICKAVREFSDASADAEAILGLTIDQLETASLLHSEIAATGLELRDGTASYQRPWIRVLQSLKSERADDFDLLRLMA